MGTLLNPCINSMYCLLLFCIVHNMYIALYSMQKTLENIKNCGMYCGYSKHSK